MNYDFAEYLLEARSPNPTGEKKEKGNWIQNRDKEISNDMALKSNFSILLKDLTPHYDHDLKSWDGNIAALAYHILNLNKRASPTGSYKSSKTLYSDLKALHDDKSAMRAAKVDKIDYSRDAVEKTDDNKKDDTNIIVKNWPTYAEFRKQMYETTVRLGWPKSETISKLIDDKKVPTTNDLWTSSKKQTPYFFESWAPDFMQKTANTMKAQIMSDFRGKSNELQILSSKVDQIVDLEKKQFKKESTILNVLGGIGMFVFKGLGGQERDLAFFDWLKSKFKKMTIFEYQQAVLEDVRLRMNITDDASIVLKNMLTKTYTLVKKACDVSNGAQIETPKIGKRGHYDIECYFYVKPKNAASNTDEVDYLFLQLMQGFDYENGKGMQENGIIMKFVKSIGDSPAFTSGPSELNIKTLCELGRKDKRELGKIIDKKPLEFEIEGKDKNGKVVGKYIWEIGLVPKYVKFSLIYESNGDEDV